MRLRLLPLLAVVVFALAGCGGDDTTASPSTTSSVTSATPSATTTPTPTPSPVYWTKDEAGQQYLEMVKPINAAVSALGASFSYDESDWGVIRDKCANIVPASDAFMRALNDGKWDPALRPDVDAVIAHTSGAHSWYVACANATKRADLDVLGNVTSQDPGAAQRLRVKLGLPSVGS